MNSVIFDGSIGGDDLPPFKPIINPIQREEISNVLNIDVMRIDLLQVHIYNVNESDDIDIILQTGKKYQIKYITEEGVVTSVGVLSKFDIGYLAPFSTVRLIDGRKNIGAHDKCFIRLDCSEVGSCKIVDILVKAIRDIKEITEENNTDTSEQA